MSVPTFQGAASRSPANNVFEACSPSCVLNKVSPDSRRLPLSPTGGGPHALLEPTGRLILPLRRTQRDETLIPSRSPDAAVRRRLLTSLIDHSIPSLMPVSAVCDCSIATSMQPGPALIALGMSPAWKRALDARSGHAPEIEPGFSHASWRNWGTGLARALDALHARGIAHNDAFPHNIVVLGSEASWIDLGDISDEPAALARENAIFILFTMIGSLQRCAEMSLDLVARLGRIFATHDRPDTLSRIIELLSSEPVDLTPTDAARLRHAFASSSVATLGETASSDAHGLLIKAALEYSAAFAFVSAERDGLADQVRAERAKNWLQEYERNRLSVPRGELNRVINESTRSTQAVMEHNGKLIARIKELEQELAASRTLLSATDDATSTTESENASVSVEQALANLRAALISTPGQPVPDANSIASFDAALSRLKELAATRSWRIAKTLQFVNAEILRNSGSNRTQAIRKLGRRLSGRAPLAGYDTLASSMTALYEWRSTVLKRVDGLARTVTVSGAHLTKSVKPQPDSAVTASGHITPHVGGLVSIVLPVYNHAGFLEEAISGVLTQTWRDWELIVVDDGSKDNFDEVIARFANDPRIKVLTQPNQRLPSALNNGFAHARGEFLTWTSADNVMLPTQIERLIAALRAAPHAGFAYSDYEAIDDRGEPLSDRAWRAHNREDGSALIHLPPAATIANLHESGDNFIGASFMYRADVATVVGPYDEDTFGGEDYDYWMRLHLVTPFVHVPEVLYRYRVHDNTLNAKATELGLLPNIRKVLESDKERRTTLLAGDLAAAEKNTFWRSSAQYAHLAHPEPDWFDLSEMLPEAELTATAHERVRIVRIDVPLRKIDLRPLRAADVILCPDALTYAWLREQRLSPRTRLVLATGDTIEVQHAVELVAFEKQEAIRGRVMVSKPPAHAHSAQLPRHVLLVAGRWSRGGLEQVMLDLASGMKAKGIRVTLAVADERLPQSLRQTGEKLGLETVGFDGNAAALAQYAKSSAIDLVNFHHAITGHAELKCEGIAAVYTFHNSYIWLDAARRGQWRSAMKDMAATIAVSRQVASYATAHFGTDPATCFVIPNGVDLSGLAMPPGEDQSTFTFISVANFNRVKMQDSLLRAFARVRRSAENARLLLVGHASDRQYFDEVVALSRKLELGAAVSLLEHQPRAEVLARLSQSQCFVLPSLLEGASISLLEALAAGIPAIATDVGSARDLKSLSGGLVVVPAIVDDLDTIDELGMWNTLRSQHPVLEANLAAAMLSVMKDHSVLARRANADVTSIVTSCRIDDMVDRYLACFASATHNSMPHPRIERS